MQAAPAASLKARALRRLVTTLVVLAFLLFASAGSWRFWQAGLFLGLMAGLWSYFLIDLLERSPQLLERRLRHEEVDAAQKMFQRIFVPVTFAAFALTGLDFRFGWSGIGLDLFRLRSCSRRRRSRLPDIGSCSGL